MFEAQFAEQGTWAGQNIDPVVPSVINVGQSSHEVVKLSVFTDGKWREVTSISKFQQGNWITKRQEDLW